MRFLRHRGIFQSDVVFCSARSARCKLSPGYRLLTTSRLPGNLVRGQDHPLPSSPAVLRARTKLKDVQEEHALGHHRLDEFRPANPRSGCSPAEPVSASPVTIRINLLQDRAKEIIIEW